MVIYVLSIQPFVLYIKLFMMHFLCILAGRPCHIQEVISQHLIGISTKFFQYSKAHALLSDHHLCQVVPKWLPVSVMIKSIEIKCSLPFFLFSVGPCV